MTKFNLMKVTGKLIGGSVGKVIVTEKNVVEKASGALIYTTGPEYEKSLSINKSALNVMFYTQQYKERSKGIPVIPEVAKDESKETLERMKIRESP